MKATLIIIENDNDHSQAKALIDELMGPEDAADRARMMAQACFIEVFMVRKLRERFQISADLLISPKRARGIAA